MSRGTERPVRPAAIPVEPLDDQGSDGSLRQWVAAAAEWEKQHNLMSYIGVLGGLLIYFAPDYLPAFFGLAPVPDVPWWSRVSKIFQWVGATAAVTFAVNIILGWKSTIKYVEARMSSVIRDNEPFFAAMITTVLQRSIEEKSFLEQVTVNVLTETHANIIEVLNDGKTFPHDGSFYSTLRTQIEPLLVGPHIESMDLKIDNYFFQFQGEPVILSRRTITTTYHSRNQSSIELGFGKTLRLVEGVDPAKHYKLDSFHIDGEDLSHQLEGPVLNPDDPTRCEWSIGHRCELSPRGMLRVYRRETLLLPADDIFDWRVRGTTSAKQVTVTASFDREVNPRLIVYGLAGPDCETPTPSSNYCYVDWTGWMLPQHSVVMAWDRPSETDSLPELHAEYVDTPLPPTD